MARRGDLGQGDVGVVARDAERLRGALHRLLDAVRRRPGREHEATHAEDRAGLTDEFDGFARALVDVGVPPAVQPLFRHHPFIIARRFGL